VIQPEFRKGEFSIFRGNRPSPLKLVSSSDRKTLSPDAQRVLDKLADLPPSNTIAEMRQRHIESRKPLLAPLEEVGEIVHLRPRVDDAPSMTVFRPRGAQPGDILPALVFLHGGGWTVGNLQTYEPLCRQLSNATGYAVVYVEYRLAPEHPFPAAFDDARKALHWVHQNSGWLGIDRSSIGIGGDSSGGNLAAAVCLAERNDHAAFRPAFQLLIYPCLDMTASLPSHGELAEGFLLTKEIYQLYRSNYVGKFPKPGHWRLSPLFAHDVSDLPPAVILYAGFDPLRDEAATYAERLQNAGNVVETLFFPDMIHGFVNMGAEIPAAHVAVRRIAKALDRIVSD
jgi:acetyl esterase